jgi:hypothetical protein
MKEHARDVVAKKYRRQSIMDFDLLSPGFDKS